MTQLNLSQCLCSFKTRTRETVRASERNDEPSMRVGDLAVFSEASRDSVIMSGLLAIGHDRPCILANTIHIDKKIFRICSKYEENIFNSLIFIRRESHYSV